jgi:2-phospho-L-lactate guanylyltransferase
MRTLAVLPVKRFHLAKQRLSAELSAEFRHALAEAMVADVLTALTACAEVEAILVITNEPAVIALAAAHGAEAAADPHESGQSAAATIGLARAIADGYERALLVPGDCPAIDPDELSGLLGEGRPGKSVVIVPDRHGLGTNALLLCPPNALAPTFGPGSCRRHQERAAAAGAVCRVAQVPSLALDVDTPRDLEVLREALEIRSGHAAQTRAVLEGAEPPPAPAAPPTPPPRRARQRLTAPPAPAPIPGPVADPGSDPVPVPVSDPVPVPGSDPVPVPVSDPVPVPVSDPVPVPGPVSDPVPVPVPDGETGNPQPGTAPTAPAGPAPAAEPATPPASADPAADAEGGLPA